VDGGLLYRSGAVELTLAGKAALDKIAAQLEDPAYTVDVVGNTDDVPIGRELAARYPTHWELVGARAALVVRHLQAQGVDPARMQADSAGQYHPLAPNDSPQNRAQNRRTDILLRPH
jgi:chemotaxis protein MotB